MLIRGMGLALWVALWRMRIGPEHALRKRETRKAAIGVTALDAIIVSVHMPLASLSRLHYAVDMTIL